MSINAIISAHFDNAVNLRAKNYCQERHFIQNKTKPKTKATTAKTNKQTTQKTSKQKTQNPKTKNLARALFLLFVLILVHWCLLTMLPSSGSDWETKLERYSGGEGRKGL